MLAFQDHPAPHGPIRPPEVSENPRPFRQKRPRDSGKTGARIILNAHRQSDADRLQ